MGGGHCRCDVHVENFLDNPSGSGAGKATFGSDAEILHISPRHFDPAECAIGAVRSVNQAEIKLRATWELRLRQRLIEGVVVSRHRNGNMEVRYWTIYCGGERTHDFDHLCRIYWLHKVTRAKVAVAQVKAQFDRVRDWCANPRDPINDLFG